VRQPRAAQRDVAVLVRRGTVGGSDESERELQRELLVQGFALDSAVRGR